MTGNLTRRLSALEGRAKATSAASYRVFITPVGLDRAAEDRWKAEHVAPARAAGKQVLVVRFVSPVRPVGVALS